MSYIDYIEKINHGIAAFPIQYYYVDKTHPRYVMNAHWHREFEIIRVLSGEFTVYLNNTAHNLVENDIMFVECGCLHRGQPTECVYECIVVDLKMLSPRRDDLVDRYISQIVNSNVSIKNIISREDRNLHRTASDLFASMNAAKPYYELSVYGLLFCLVSQMYTQGYISVSNCAQTNKHVELIGSLLDWISLNLKEPITSEKLSEISSLNFNYLCKIFKSFTGKTIVQYINEQRIEHACFDISGNSSITEAAFKNGFNDLSYFGKTFKRYKGMTPKEFKSLAKNGSKS